MINSAQPIKVTPITAGVIEAAAILTILHDLGGQASTPAQLDSFAHSLNQQQLGIAYEALFDPFVANTVKDEFVLTTINHAPSAFDASPIHAPTLTEDALAIQLIGQHSFIIGY